MVKTAKESKKAVNPAENGWIHRLLSTIYCELVEK